MGTDEVMVPYADHFDADDQVSAEEEIAGYVHDNTTAGEDLSAEMGRKILYMVLRRFRPDLFLTKTP